MHGRDPPYSHRHLMTVDDDGEVGEVGAEDVQQVRPSTKHDMHIGGFYLRFAHSIRTPNISLKSASALQPR